MVDFTTQTPGDDFQVQKGEAVDIRSQVKGNTRALKKKKKAINTSFLEARMCPQTQGTIVPNRMELIGLCQKAAANIKACSHWGEMETEDSI